MALNIATLVARVVADTGGFNAEMAGVEGRLQSVGSSFQRTGGMLTRSLTLPILVAAGAAVKFGIDFQQQMEMIHTQAGASQAEVEKMTQAVLALAPATRYGPDELSKALYHIESVGDHGAKAMDVLKVAAQGAAVGNANLEDTASALAGTLRVFHVPAADAASIMGQLNAIVGAGNMRMQDLNNAISTGLLPTAKGLGIGLNEIGAAMATMTDESVPAQVSATRLRTLLLLMTGETTKSVKTLESIGIAQGELGAKMREPGGMIPALQDLQEHLARFSKTDQVRLLAEAFGGARSAGTIIQLLNNLNMVQMKLDQINRTAGNFPEDVLRTTQTEAYKLHSAWAAIQTVLVRVGEILAPTVSKIAGDVAHLLGAFDHLSKPIQDIIVYGGLFVAALGPVLWIIGSLASALALVATPVGAVVVGLIAIGAAGAYVYQHFQAAQDVMKGFWDFLTGAAPTNAGTHIHGLLDGMSQDMGRTHDTVMTLQDAWGKVTPYISTATDTIGRVVHSVSSFAVQEFDRMKSGIMAHSAEIKAFLAAAWRDIQIVFQTVMPIIENIVTTAWNVIKIVIDTTMKVIGNIILAIMDVISGNWSGAWHAIERATGDLLRGIADLITTILKGLIGVTLIIATDIGKALWFGIKKVGEYLASFGNYLMTEIGKAISEVISWVVGHARGIGSGIVHGIIDGVTGLPGELAGKLKGMVSGAISSVGGFLGIHSPSAYTRDKLGKPIAEGIIEGYLLGIGNLPSKMSSTLRAAIEAARNEVQAGQTKLQTAFQRLADYALRAFDGATQAHLQKMQSNFNALIKDKVTVPMMSAIDALDAAHQMAMDAIQGQGSAATPTEALIAQMQSQHEEAARQDAIAQAQQGLADAQKGTDPAAILSAQKSLNDALYTEQIATLQKQANTERTAQDALTKIKTDVENASYAFQQKAIQDQFALVQAGLQKTYDTQVLNYQSQRDLQRQHLEDMFTQMDTELQKHPELWKKYHAIIMKQFKDVFGPDYKTAGKNLGTGFAQGIREAFPAVTAAVNDLAKIIENALKLHSPAKTGPMADLNTWWKPMSATLLAGLTPEELQRGLYDYVPRPAAGSSFGLNAAASTGTQGAASTVVQITLPGATFLSGDRNAAREVATLLAPLIEQQVGIKT